MTPAELATGGFKFCEQLLDAVRRNFLGNVSSLTRKPHAEAFSLRSDFAGQNLVHRYQKLDDEPCRRRKMPCGFRKV